MDTKRNICDIWTWEKHLFLDISSINNDTRPISLPVRRNPQHRNLSTVVSATSASRHQRNVCHPVVNRFTQQALPTLNRKHFPMISLCIESFSLPPKRATERCSSLVHSSSTVAILTTETSFWRCVCASAIYTVMKLDCAATQWYTQKIYYIHYSSFTSVCDLFTVSGSYATKQILVRFSLRVLTKICREGLALVRIEPTQLPVYTDTK
jgi:hypothetical protein